MALSFKDSMKQQKASPNDEYNIATLDLNNEEMAVYPEVTTYATDDFTVSNKYLWYDDYSDDEVSTIDIKKNISVNENQINITQESNSQFIPFQMNRFYDGMDLMKMTIMIHYVTAGDYEDNATPINVTYNNEKIRFGWLVGKNATSHTGELKFEIQAIGTNSKGNEYIWKTKPNGRLNILESLSGNGIIEPDESWITSFLSQVTEKVGEAQNAADQARSYANDAAKSASSAGTVVTNAKNELSKQVDTSIANSLKSYYTSAQVDELMKNVDLSDVYKKIDAIDGLAKFKVTYDSSKNILTFYNDTTVIKTIQLNSDPSAEWVSSYSNIVDGKISTAVNNVSNALNEYKTTTNADLQSIHESIDDLPETLKTDYYNKESVDNLLKGKANASDINSLTSKVSVIEQTANTNKGNISSVSTKVAELETTIGEIDTSPRKTYDATYDEEYNYTLWEIENEGEDSEVRTAKSQFKIIGGGGGGGQTSSVLKIEYVTTSPLIVTTNDQAIIKYNFSGTDSSGDEVTDGTYTWKIGKTIIATGTAVSGENTFDATNFITIGSQKLTLSITDDAGSLVTKSWTVQKVDIKIESTFNDRLTYNLGEVSFDYTPYGAIKKDVHFILDGKELEKVTTSVSGISMSYTLPAQEHGTHLLEAYITAEINSRTIETNHIYKDIIWYNPTSDKPVIGCTQVQFATKQYDTANITYTVYDPHTESPTVTLAVDGTIVSTLQLDSNTQVWQYKPTDVGNHVLTITCRDTVKTLNVTVEKLDIDVEPVTAGLIFDFNPVGRSNNDTNRLWSCENNNDIKMTVSDNFDWVNGGYQIDENGDQYFGIQAGTTAYISHNLFSDDARRNGKEFKLIFKTSNVAKSNASFLTCQSGDTTQIGLQMNVHEAYIKSSVKPLYIPYSEEDIIEWEFNINKDTDIPIVMSYEDGTPCRPMSYTSDYSFTQENPVGITIGSPDCDVAIYRMKAYNTSLTSKAILSNFIADARTATEMINRYTRNQIYDENQLLTPESVAEACPDMRVIKIESPIFTNDKKNFIKNASMECIYKNGDPTLDNWKIENGYVVGQGTTSNEYGAAGRNLDFIFCADGVNKINSKIAFDPEYKSKITYGDGSVIDDGTGAITLTRNSVPMRWTNIKVNIASSELVDNAYGQKRYNDYLPYTSPAQRRDSKVKNSMEFVNCVVFIKENNPDISTHREFQDCEWHFYALGNMGDSKKTDLTRAYDPDDMKEFCVEISDNTLANSTFQTGVKNSDGSEKYPITKTEWTTGNTAYDALYNDWDGSFEFRYDCCGDSKDGNPTSSDEAKTEIRTKNRQIWRDFYEFVITSTDEEFVSNLKNWMIVDSILYFYLFTLRYTMIDNRAKNTFWHWAKHYITSDEAKTMGEESAYYTIDDEAAGINNGYRFDLWAYDMDTGWGINNSGELTMTYGKEDTDYRTDGVPSSGYIFNAAESVIFCRVRDLMTTQLRTMYQSCESKNCWSATSLINEFDEKQNEWCEELWRLDYERKYERTYREGNTRFLENMMNGKKKYQRRQFERDQEIYMATKFLGTSATSNQIMFRCNTPVDAVVKPDYTLHLTPYQDMYLSVMFGNSSPTQVRAKAGKQYDIPCPYTTMDDTAVLVYGASRIQSMGDISACYIHDNDFSKAEKLKELIIGNITEGYSNEFLTNLVIGNNKLLEKLDIRNTPKLASSLDLSKCKNLLELYANGSALTGILFANGGKIQKAELPATLTSVNMRNLIYLTDLSIAGYDVITTIILENCDIIDSVELLNKCNKLNRVRILGINWELDDTTLLDRLYNMAGIDKNGYNTDRSVLTGKVHVPVVKQNQLQNYNTAWSDLEVEYNTLIAQFKVTFLNEDGSVLDIQYVDKGSKPVDPITRVDNPIATPTKDSDQQYDYTFNGWNSEFVPAFSDTTIKATYTSSIRKYTVRYMNNSQVLQETTTEYGTVVFYNGDIPVYTAEEAAFKYYLFKGWDKSGLVDGNKDIHAVYDSFEYVTGYFDNKELADLTPVELYGMLKVGIESEHLTEKDSLTIQLGNDISYDDVDEKVIINSKTDFSGKNYIDTDIKLFDKDKDFVLAIDYKFDKNSKNNNTLVQCFQSNGMNGFRLWYNDGSKTAWGTSATIAGNVGNREMLVLRHKKGDNNLYVYNSNLTGNDMSIVELSKTRSTVTDSTLVFGCAKADDGAYENYGIGTIYWSKIWYFDLGDEACKSLATWVHEDLPLELSGFKKYYLSDDSGKRASITLLASQLLSISKPLGTGTSNVGGWNKCTLGEFLDSRLLNAIPIQWRQLIKQVKVNSSSGNKSTEIVSSNNYIYIPCAIELNPTMTEEPYCYEGAGINYFTTNASRICRAEDGIAYEYLTRSPNVQYNEYYFHIQDTGSLYGYFYPYYSARLRIMFSI